LLRESNTEMRSHDAIPFTENSIRGLLHQPVGNAKGGVVLTHGAGGNCKAPLLEAVADTLCSAGYWVLRCDLPFRQQRPFGPPFPRSAADDRAGLRDAVAAVRRINTGPIFLGGHSYGGRQATILVAEDPALCDGLLLLSYPLHPPRKPSELRTAHFPALQARALFVHGTADPFGSIEEMRASLQLIPARTDLVAIERAGHDLARGKFDIAGLVVNKFGALIGS
jgi:uncharacterized protein